LSRSRMIRSVCRRRPMPDRSHDETIRLRSGACSAELA
jgi:hypothetical protein